MLNVQNSKFKEVIMKRVKHYCAVRRPRRAANSFMAYFIVLPALFFILLFAGGAIAQEEFDDGGVVMAEEVIIRVEPEIPTVIVDVKRKTPDIDIGELKRPEEASLFNKPSSIKPRLFDIEVKKVEKPKKMLAKDRKH